MARPAPGSSTPWPPKRNCTVCASSGPAPAAPATNWCTGWNGPSSRTCTSSISAWGPSSGASAGGTGEQLVYGLEGALEQDMHVDNLSLGTVQRRIYTQLHDLVDRAYFEGRILVAAANNRAQPSYPSQFATLIAVDNEAL